MSLPPIHPTAILVDDEVNVTEHLQNKLAKLWPELQILGTAINGRQAIALAEETDPDIVFLDIHMPGMNGLQVAEQLPDGAQLVFVTAFDQYAVAAFERAAADYIMKPVTDGRLKHTIERLQYQLSPQADQAGSADRNQVLQMLADIAKASDTPQGHLQWLRSGLEDVTELVAVGDVIFFQSEDKYTNAVTASATHLLRTPIKALEEQLNPDEFWRVHRGTIVRVDQVIKARRDIRGRYTLTLRDHPTKLLCSQRYGHLFKQM